MHLNMYFIGNVLSPTEGQPEADDPTFAFTKKESQNLNLDNCPINMEHDEKMNVGHVIRSWNQDDGSKWILGKLKNQSFMEKFANYAIKKDPLTNSTYYTGLSLQHEHITHFASGKTEKKAIEISLCADPRRDDCRIAMVKGLPNLEQTEKLTYKLNNISNKMEETKPVEQTPEKQTETQEANQMKMSPEKMMEVIIQLQKEKDEKEASTQAEKKELEELKEMIKKQEEEAFKKDQAKSMAFVRALTDQWATELDQDTMSDAQKESIVDLAKNYPRESMELLRVAHCASKKHKTISSEYASFKKNAEQSALSEKFDAVMQKRKAPETVVHKASTREVKRAKKSDVQHFLTAMKQYNVSGSARDHMEKVSQIGYRKRSNRSTYF